MVGPARHARVLIAEDGASFRSALERMLRSAGYEVDSVGDGEAALERLLDAAAARIDLLLVDVNLPGRSGTDVIAAARAELGTPPACVFMSGSLSDASAAEDRHEAILVKPFGADELLAKVDAVLDLVDRSQTLRPKLAAPENAGRRRPRSPT